MSAPSHADRLAEAVAAEGLDALIVADLVRPGDSSREAQANVFWACGFTGTSALCMLSSTERLFFTDFRYVERAEREVDDSFERIRVEQRLLPAAAERLGGRVGYDEAHTSVAKLRRLSEHVSDEVELVAATGLVDGLRRSKDRAELERIAEAARLADDVYEWMVERGFAGRTEREVALAAEQRMRELGAQGSAFPAIVASGPNSALPHHEPGEREIGSHDVVLIDMGAIVDGYCSDCTRTFVCGDPDGEFVEVYELVRSAQAAALEAVGAGVEGVAADAVARDAIVAAGHGDHFGHGLGHGVGIEVHEPPRLAPRSDDELQVGDVVTVEPGVYLPNRFGVRIEDLVAITDAGPRNLSGLGKELRVVG